MKIWERVPNSIRIKCSQIERSIVSSENLLLPIKDAIVTHLETLPGNLALVFAGSVGRKEVLDTSDIDAFVLFEEPSDHNKEHAKQILTRLSLALTENRIELKMASAGAFSSLCTLTELISTIGGHKETNHMLTQRMTLLVESQGISVGQYFENSRRRILKKYLEELQTIERRPIFLINDLARYYRTVCVDYEYKKNEVGKPWAIRLIKLRHSRKLFYFSALLPLLDSMTINDPNERLEWIKQQFLDRSPLERLIFLLEKYGSEDHWELLSCYNSFLELLSSKQRRSHLDTIDFELRKDDDDYMLMRENARTFRAKLLDFMLSVDSWQEDIRKYVIC